MTMQVSGVWRNGAGVSQQVTPAGLWAALDQLQRTGAKVSWQFGPSLDATQFGVTGDGVTDDTAAIQAALAAANKQALADGINYAVQLPAGTYQISGQLLVPYGVQLRGAGARATRIRVASTFAALTATGAIRIGDGTAPVFGTGVADLMVECSNLAGSIGIYSSDLQDNCFIRGVLINNFDSFGIRLNGAAGAFGSTNACRLQDIEVYRANIAGGAGAVGISIENGSFGILLENVSSLGKVGNILGVGIQSINCPLLVICAHLEQVTDGVKIGTGAFASIMGLTANVATNLLHITAVTSSVVAMALSRFGGGINTVLDDGAGHTGAIALTPGTVPFYSRAGIVAPTLGNLPVLDGIQMQGPVISSRPAPAWAAAIAINALDGENFLITATSNIAATVSAPTNPPAAGFSQRIRLIFFNNSGGALTTAIAFNAAFKTSGAVSPAAGTTITVEFTWDQNRALWLEAGRSAAV